MHNNKEKLDGYNEVISSNIEEVNAKYPKEKKKLRDKDKGYFFYKISHTEYKVLLASIIFFESKGRQVRMVTTRKEYVFYDTLKGILQRINSTKFIQVHKGFIVNYNYVVAFNSKWLSLSNYMTIPIGLSKQKEVKQIKIKWGESNT